MNYIYGFWFAEEGEAVSHVLSVRMSAEMRRDIEIAGIQYELTKSWVVRYCLFRHIRRLQRQLFRRVPLPENISSGGQVRNDDYRFRLCLYGDDIHIIRDIASKTGVSMAELVRQALGAYLTYFASRVINPRLLFWYGIKIVRKQSQIVHRSGHRGYLRMEVFKGRPVEEYWGSGRFPLVPTPLFWKERCWAAA